MRDVVFSLGTLPSFVYGRGTQPEGRGSVWRYVKANATGVSTSSRPLPPEPESPERLTGAAEAVTALYEAHALGLIRLGVIMLGDRPAAEDVVQEAFCGLYRRWHSLSDTTKALAYTAATGGSA